MSGLLLGLGRIQSATGGLAAATGTVASIAGTAASIADGSWLANLLPASWRGIPFQIRGTRFQAGRRVALHVYPFRDDCWPEDLGRAERLFDFSAFVIGDDCHAQAKRLIEAAERPGDGVLNHPWLGPRTVTLLEPLEGSERFDLGRVIELRFRFVQGGKPVYPSSAADTQSASNAAGLSAFLAQTAAFAGKVAGIAGLGATVVRAGVAVVRGFVAQAQELGGDSALIQHAVAGLPPPPGAWYGRDGAGSRTRLLSGASDSAGAIAAVTTARAQLAAASANAAAQALVMGAGNPLPPAVLAVTGQLRGCCNDPADAVRLLSALAAHPVAVDAGTGPTSLKVAALQQATGALCRQAALVSLAAACATLRPANAADARAVRDGVVALFDAEILRAADLGAGPEYAALRRLRTAMIADLNARAAQLPDLVEVHTAVPMPALVLAYKLYGDAGRADELTARSGAVSSLFLPTAFEALSR